MRIKEILVVISLFSALTISFGFTANRTEWSAVPQLNPRPQVSVEVLMKDAQAKGFDDALRSSEEKKSLKRENVTIAETPLREKSSENQTNFIVKLIAEPKVRFNRREKVAKDSIKNGPLNVILLLIDGLDRNEENERMDLENSESFPIQGFLQSCPEKQEWSGPESFYFADRSAVCDCDDLLRSNVASLLSWAQHIKEMSTSVLYEMPTFYSRRIEMDTRSFMRPQVRRIDRQLHESWQLNDARKTKLSEAPSTPIESSQYHTRQFNANDNDNDDGHLAEADVGLWRVLSRLREAFFRTLLGGPRVLASSPPRQRPDAGASGFQFRELAARTLEELNSEPANERGYALVASAAARELADALELLRRYVTPANTLIVVTSTCPRDPQSIPAPFFARGPGSEHLLAVGSLVELPDALRAILVGTECPEYATNCPVKRGRERDAPRIAVQTVEPMVLSFGEPILVIDPEAEEQTQPRGRFERDEQAQKLTLQIFKRSDKDEKQKVPEAKILQETKPAVTKTTEKRSEKSKSKEISADVDIQMRMGNENAVTNSQDINSHLTVIFITIVAFTITYSLTY